MDNVSDYFPERVAQMMHRDKNNSYVSNDGKRLNSPFKTLKDYNNRSQNDVNRTLIVHEKKSLGNLAQGKSMGNMSRNDNLKKIKSNMPGQIKSGNLINAPFYKLNVLDVRNDNSLISKQYGYKDEAKPVISIHQAPNMKKNYKGTFSHNEQILNQFVKQRRADQEMFNKVLG
jgi:hypothetical protein